MANKSKKPKKEDIEKVNKQRWLIICMFLLLLIILSVFKLGTIGIFLNDLFVYIFGSLYVICLLSFLSIAIYDHLFSNTKVLKKHVIALVLFNIFVLLLGSYISNETDNLSKWYEYLINNIKLIGKNQFKFTGGVIGNFIYGLFTSLVTRVGTILFMIFILLIALIFVVPKQLIIYLYNGSKNTVSNINNRLDENKQNRLVAKEKRQEEERQREIEEFRRLQEAREIQKREEIKKQHEIKLEEKRQENIKKIEEQKKVFGSSNVFIHLTDKEIYGYEKNEIEDDFDDDDYEYEYSENISLTDDFSNYFDQNDTLPLFDDVEENIVETPKKTQEKAKPNVIKPKKNTAYKIPKHYEQFLERPTSDSSTINKTSAEVKGEKVIEILKNFGIEAELVKTYIGPSVTKFEIKPDSSVKINRIMNISDNIKMELAAKDIRIEAPMPGRSAVGIEIPNVEPIPVKLLELMNKIPADKKDDKLLFALGKDLMGQPVYCDLAKMPHLLIAGATGSGKSVCINTTISSYLLRTNPKDVKLVLVDPKKVEFTSYKDIPHLLWPIIDDATMASNMLKKVVVLMEERYELFASVGVRNIIGYNQYVEDYNSNLKADENPMEKLPYIVVIIDELADLMAIAKKEVELSIQRITQLARASGIHLIVATQRPSTDVITGLIKSNIPSRISLSVASSIDSRTILDQVGAERLLGNGDMLYYPQGETAPIRLQGVYVSDKEINNITSYVKSLAEPEYDDTYFEFLRNEETYGSSNGSSAVNADSTDSLYDEVVEFVKAQQKASTSLLQRRFGIGYNRAARLIDTLESKGVVGPANGSKPREVYLKPDEVDVDL